MQIVYHFRNCIMLKCFGWFSGLISSSIIETGTKATNQSFTFAVSNHQDSDCLFLDIHDIAIISS